MLWYLAFTCAVLCWLLAVGAIVYLLCADGYRIEQAQWRCYLELSYPRWPSRHVDEYAHEGYWRAHRWTLWRYRFTFERPIPQAAYEYRLEQRRRQEQRRNEVQAQRRYRSRPVTHRWLALGRQERLYRAYDQAAHDPEFLKDFGR